MHYHALQGGILQFYTPNALLYNIIECLLSNVQYYTFQGTITVSYDHNKLFILHLLGLFYFFDHIIYSCTLISLCIKGYNNYNYSCKGIDLFQFRMASLTNLEILNIFITSLRFNKIKFKIKHLI